MEFAGFILVDPEGRVLAANAEARAMLSEHDGLMLDQDRVATSTGPCPKAGLMRVARPSGRKPYVLRVTPLHSGSARPHYRAVTIYRSSARHTLGLELLRITYKFTRAELDLAEQVLSGRNAQEAAEALEVSIHSVRTYLKRLFTKVGVRTQAKLVQHLLQVVQSLPDSPH